MIEQQTDNLLMVVRFHLSLPILQLDGGGVSKRRRG